jgi:hypothetical protein
MKAGYKRDKDAYVFATLSNKKILLKPKLRELLEEEQLSGEELYRKYVQNTEFFKKPLREHEEQNAPNDARLERIEKATAGLREKIGELARQLQFMLVAAAIVLALLYYFRK